MPTKENHFDKDCYNDVPKTSHNFSSGGTSSSAAKQATDSERADASVLALNRTWISPALAPLFFDIDVTGSNVEFANIFFDKFKTFWRQILYPGKTVQEIEMIEKGKKQMDVVPYLTSFDLSLGYVGDASGDTYPHQYTNHVVGGELFKWLKKMNREKGGGANKKESYEIAALRVLRYCNFLSAITPFYFLVGDEAPYTIIKRNEVRKYLDSGYDEELTTKQVYAELFRKFQGNVYIIQNPYFGRHNDGEMKYPRETKNMTEEWRKVIPSEYQGNLIFLLEEKAIVDVMLGIIARRSGARDKAGYTRDMVTKGQSVDRIEMVNRMLSFLDNVNVKAGQMPDNDVEGMDSCGQMM